MEPTNLHTESWIPFFGATAEISGGLVGLVFLTLTFKPDVFGVAGDVGMRRLAGQVFTDFLSVLLLSLVMMVPSPGRWIAWMPGIVGALGAQRVVRSLVEVHRARGGAVPYGLVARRLLMSLGGNVALIVASGAAMGSSPHDLFWWLVVGGVLVLVLAGSRSAWLLVTHAAG